MWFAAVVKMIALGNDVHLARPATRACEFLGGITSAVFLLDTYREHWAFDYRRNTNGPRPRHDAVEKTFRADHIPPARHEHQLTAAACGNQRTRLLCQLLQFVHRE